MAKKQGLKTRLNNHDHQIDPLGQDIKKEIINILLPWTSWRRRITKKILFGLHLKSSVVAGYYNTFSQQQRSRPELRKELKDISSAPLISIVVPAYNTSRRYLDDLVYSIISQAYENWELVLVNASSESKPKKNIDACANKDTRIKVISVANSGISDNTNKGIKVASGEYIAFCDHDDILEPFALYEVALKIIDEKAELIYTDEDKISDDGEVYFDPHFKPDWSPDLFTHVNYTNHLTVVKKSLVIKAGLLNPDRDGAQDYDLMLRIIDLNPKIAHVAKVLYHWRATHNSTAQDFSSKKNVTIAGKTALEDHFSRHSIKVQAIPKEHQPGFYELVFNEVENVSIIIMPFMPDAFLRLFIELLIKKTNHATVKFQLIVPDGTLPRFKSDNIKIVTIKSDDDFLKNAINVSSFNNLIIFNQTALPNVKDWANRLCSMLEQPHIKAVSPLIVRNGDVIDDCGLVRDGVGNYLALFKDQPAYNNQTFLGNTNWVRNVDALTGGVVAVRKSQFEPFLSTYDKNMYKAVFEFSTMSYTDKYNTIYTEVVADSYAIQLSPKDMDVSLFNNNLTVSGKDYVPYTPETSAINILLRVAEQEGLSV